MRAPRLLLVLIPVFVNLARVRTAKYARLGFIRLQIFSSQIFAAISVIVQLTTFAVTVYLIIAGALGSELGAAAWYVLRKSWNAKAKVPEQPESPAL